MIDYNFDEYCCGCGVCSNCCPSGAIKMVPNLYGFLIPHIDKNKCTKCGICDKVCPHINKNSIQYEENDAKGTWLYSSVDDEAKMRSASGGVFYELAKYYVTNQQYVCGCIWDDSLKAIHIIDNKLNGIQLMQGSKYVQSNVGDCYYKIMQLLKSGNKVLFSGTPCQAVAMHNMVMSIANGKYRDDLLTVGVLCHGVATPEAWESYKDWISKKKGSRLKAVNFRDKSRKGYRKSYCKYEYESGEVSYIPTFLPTSKYIEATLVYNLAIRNSCSHCECKGINVGCDLIIGDWYAECKGKGSLGTSCIVAFTERGKKAVSDILVGLQDFVYEKVLEDNGFIEKSVSLGSKRDVFLKNMNNDNFWETVEDLYPKKYKFKKLLVRLGLFNIMKKIIR